MPQPLLTITESDLLVLEQLQDFLPERVFDAHTHMHVRETIPLCRDGVGWERPLGTPEEYEVDMRPFCPGAKMFRLNMMPMPDPVMNDRANGMLDKANAHIRTLLKQHPQHVGAAYILSDDTEEQIAQAVAYPGIRAIKCYCYAAKHVQNWEDAYIQDFLPESAWLVSASRSIPIILHMMRRKALSDPENFAYILKMTKKYPDAKLVLAHCARGFASWTAVDAIKRLPELENVWFDVSAICESAPIAACILKTAAKRVVWGSDYPMPMRRGRAISIAASSHWLCDEWYFAKMGISACAFALEELMALRQACVLLELDRTQIEDIFYNNALTLFGIDA